MLYNLGDLPAVISKGERLVQAVFTKFLIADNDRKTGKIRTGGFGSTGS
jgi:dUTP pyrophosphatase